MNSDYTATVFNNKLRSLIHVLVIKDKTSRNTIVLEDQRYTLGRDPRNNIPIRSKKVSRVHGTILRREDAQNKTFSYWLLDGDLMGNRSTNGIFINDKRCLVQELKHGDLITLGMDVEGEYHILSNVDELELLREEDFAPPTRVSSTQGKGNEEGKNYGTGDEREDAPTLISSSETLFISEPTVESFDESISESAQVSEAQSEELSKLASFPEWSPNPIVEVDWSGRITYLNPAAVTKFPGLRLNETNYDHPVLEGLVKGIKKNSGSTNLFVREVKIKNQVFEQYIHYLSEQKLVRSYIFDFTGRKITATQVNESEQRYKTVLNQIREGIFLVDASTKKVLEANSALANLLGYRLDDLHSLSLNNLLSFSVGELEQKVAGWLSHPNSGVEVLGYRRKNGFSLDLESSYSVISYGDQKIISFTVHPVSENVEHQTIIQEEGLFDLETNLPNRQLFLEQLNTAIANSYRLEQLLCVIFVELELQKNLTENISKKTQSTLLEGFSKRLRSSLRSGDTVARWQGNQFVCLLPQVRSVRDIGKVCHRVLETLKPPFFLEHQKIHVKTSMGIAVYDDENNTREVILTNAQNALKKSQESGSNTYKFIQPQIQEEIERLLKLEKLLSSALEKKELCLHYQPRIKVESREITGVEAFLRWNHPELGCMYPKQFLPLAEETGLIMDIGEWVLETACFQHRIWLKNNVIQKPISINISNYQFQQPNFTNVIANVLEKTDLPSEFLELEITEETIAQDLELAQKTLLQLKEMGIKICLDDFGKGMSALGYLKQFQIDTIKIDQDIVQNLENNSQDLAIVSAIIGVGKNFNIAVVAEGIESKKQLDLLLELGCEEIQGNLLTEPLKMGDTTNFLANPNNSLTLS
ncbi:EAL domain-containing protein [Cyanobacterium stanieri LEGE 03274]|uniref:EAL domain-containing protein n=1 Tax=Cyanobacterium stanieri LEGE 03274 TaxID=1828756 RepID=A0ABR9V5V4_9CHRO|nr:EAL domain-containing protein [Cyanobacterium stanieri]MBE9223278.1 EAL domain-containing protein [Cyanobacterium stanieri LEGE 03274]